MCGCADVQARGGAGRRVTTYGAGVRVRGGAGTGVQGGSASARKCECAGARGYGYAGHRPVAVLNGLFIGS